MKSRILLPLILNCSILFAQPGKVDTTFNVQLYSTHNTGSGFTANSIMDRFVEQPDGKIITAGMNDTYNGEVRYGIARLNVDGSLDTSFDAGLTFEYNFNFSPFTDLALQSDGKIITIRTEYDVFTTKSVIRRLHPNGSLDTIPAVYGTIQQGIIQKAFFQPDGKLILCGDFQFEDTNYVIYNDIMRVNTDGTIDPSFTGANFTFISNGIVKDLKLDDQGRILIAGFFTAYNGTNSKGFVRLNTDGTIDPTFTIGTGFNNGVNSIAIQPNQKIILGGTFTNYQSSVTARGIIRLNDNGSADGTFQSTELYTSVDFLSLTSSNSIIFQASSNLPNYSNAFVRLNPNGSLDTLTAGTEFSGGGYNSFNAMRCLSTGNLMVVGQFNNYKKRYRGSIAVIDTNFMLVGSFAPKPGFNAKIDKLLVQPDGKILVGKILTSESELNVYNDTYVKGLTRLNANGLIDTTFQIADSLFVSVEAMARQSDGKILVAGMTKVFDGGALFNSRNVVRFLSDGSIDPTFNTFSCQSNDLNEILIQNDGKIIVLGSFSINSGGTFPNLIRLNTDGTIDPGFAIGTGANSVVTAGLITNSGKIIIGGDFTSFNGFPAQRLASLNSDGSFDPTFDYNGQILSVVKAIKKQPDGKLYVTAETMSDNNNIAVDLVRMNMDGSLDPTFQPIYLSNSNWGELIYNVLPLPDGKLLVAGMFSNIAFSNATGIVRLNADGTRDNSFYSTYIMNEPSVLINSLALGLDGQIVIGGEFTKVTGKPANNISLLDNDTDPYFDVSFTNVSLLNCTMNAGATAFSSGGIPPYQYQWNSGGNQLDSTQVFTNQGIYTCQVQDAVGTISSASLLIDSPQYQAGTDLKATIIADPFRPGFESTIVIYALNDGCVPSTGQLMCVLDTMLQFNSAVPAPTYQSNDTLIWDFSAMTYDNGSFLPIIETTVPVTAQIGDSVSISVNITPYSGDSDTLNNYKFYTYPIINGYDPNIKSVYPQGKCVEAFVENGQKMTYTVQFQNTGNAEAINIVVVDSLNENYDLESIHIVGKSHPVWIEIATMNTVKFHFDSILLPDSTSNEAASHGFVVFEIDPISDTLANNTLLSNKAEIYFDFNPAIVTNTCTNTIFDGDLESFVCSNPAGVESLESERTDEIKLYPNPTNSLVNIRFNNEVNGLVHVDVVDLLGKRIYMNDYQKEAGQDITIELESFTRGNYLLKVSTSEMSYPMVKVMVTR